MAEEQGIHPEVMRQLMDLHRKHADLQMQMHDKGEGESHEVFQRLLESLDKLNANIEKLIPAIEADVKADLAEAKTDKSEGSNGKRRRE